MAVNYEIKYQEKGEIKSLKLSQEDFEKEVLPANIISIKKYNKLFFENSYKIKDKEIKDILYELNLMVNSNILLNKALDILIKNKKKKEQKEFLKDLKNGFCSSNNITKNLEKYKINPLIKSLFQIVQNSGNPSSNIDFLSEIIKENYEIKKEFLKTMLYPIILSVTFLFSLIAIFNFVVPSFESILKNTQVELSFATKTLFALKDLFENYTLAFLSVLIFIVFFIRKVCKTNSKIKGIIDKILAKNIFLISSLYKLKSMYIYFVVLEILLKNKFEFLSSITQAKILLNNQYFLDRITRIEYLLKKGKSVRFAFESSDLFDDLTLSLIDTGEVTNSMPKVIAQIKEIYKKRFDDNLKVFSTLIEPLFFIIIMALILWIVFAVFVPLWSMNEMLKI